MKKRDESGNDVNPQIPFDFIAIDHNKEPVKNILRFERKLSQQLKESNSSALEKLISHAKSLNW